MDIDPLEKQFSIWNRLMYVAFGSAGTLLFASFDGLRWLVWLVLQVLVIAFGFHLLWGKKWRSLPLAGRRRNMILGYFGAGWVLLLVPAILQWQSLGQLVGPLCFLGPIFVYSIFLLFFSWHTREKASETEEIFP